MHLCHHGILGQKWGVRRYRNKDGTLTAAGKSRYRYERYQNEDGTLNERGIKNYIDKNGQLTKRGMKVYEEISQRPINSRADEELSKKGLHSKNGDDYLKKGTVVGRFATRDDAIDNRRKYVYLTDWDKQDYDDYAMNGMLGFDGPYSEFEYSLKKDIKIATAKTVLDHVVDKYGDTLVKDLYSSSTFIKIAENLKRNHFIVDDKTRVKDIIGKEYAYQKRLRDVEFKTNARNKEDAWVYKRSAAGRDVVTNFMKNNFFRNEKISGEMVKHLRDKGYDAMVDVEDYIGQQYPMIILNPKKSLKLKKRIDYDY